MANAIRALAMDAVEKAKSGHPGMPMGMADAATVLFTRHMKFDAADPGWPDRDRFVLSAGHGSMLLYALLYLLGYEDMTMAEIERFRQLGSRTAGHPEYGAARGIETTTGPLGQGLANAVGMALAERMLQARFGPEIVDHNTYVIVGDGCLMEGISHEAASLAGHLRLAKLIVLFDDNGISIDGPTSLTVSDDPLARFKAYGWDIAQVDGHDPEAVDAAIAAAKSSPAPSLIACRTTIGFGAPTKAGTAATHGAPLGAEEIAGAREALGWPHPPFAVPDEILNPWRQAGARGAAGRGDWRRRLEALDADERAAFARLQAGELPAGFADAVAECKQKLAGAGAPMATRKASQEVLEILTAEIPEMIGGSADLTGSNNTKTKVEAVITPEDFSGRYIHYGVREHAMAAVMNGMALHKGLIPYGGTFLVFTDYCRPAIRLAALMGLGVIYVMTHDSIGLGEDGPTHQPVEHLASLRAMPNLMVFRPADAVETAECWALALENRASPSVISLTRQNLEPVRAEAGEENLCARGAYVLAPADLEAGVGEAGDEGRVTLLATGSEVAIALGAREILRADGIDASVVSMPCWELFEAQTEEYRARVLGAGAVRVAVEAASPMGWDRYIGADGAMVGMGGFGASAPAADLYAHFGITAEAVAEAARQCLKAGSAAR
ncbi:MAG: transketolase [Proteobacteria bacterium]|nr:transketolase [Pseudomonadota bacterium]